MMTDRIKTLLEETARQLREGRGALNHAFLVENEVTFDECMELAEWIAIAIESAVKTSNLIVEIAEGRARRRRDDEKGSL